MSTGRAIKAGEAFIELTLRDQKMQGGLRGALRSMGRIAAAAAKVGVAMAAAFGTGALVAIQNSVRHFAQFGGQMEKMSQRTGLSAQTLTELKFAAEQSGTTIEQLGQAMFRANRRIGNAVTETGPAVRALKELNLNAKDLARQSPETQLEMLVDALADVEIPARRSQLAFEVFGDNWRQLAPLINSGSDSIRALRKEAQELGNTLTDQQAADAAKLADAMNRLKTAFQGLRTQLGATLAPAITLMLDQMTNFLVEWRKWLGEIRREFIANFRAITTVANEVFNAFGFGDIGADMEELARIFERAERIRGTRTGAGGRGALTNAVSSGLQRATVSSIGSFRGEAGVFGPTTRNIQEELRKQTRLLEEGLEAARNQPIQRF